MTSRNSARPNPQQGPMLPGQACARESVKPGEALPEEWGGGENKWPWPIPLMASNTATKPELVRATSPPKRPTSTSWSPTRCASISSSAISTDGSKIAPQATTPCPTSSCFAWATTTPLARAPAAPRPRPPSPITTSPSGRAVEPISHSPYWDDTAFFILEDDAQDGGDHVDAHRSVALVISKYAPHGPESKPFVDSRFYSTVSVIRTMETLLGLPPMNNNDALSSMISTLFTGPGDQAPYTADTSNRDNNLIYTANAKKAPGAEESMKMDFRHADHADAQKLNAILWKDAMGKTPEPASLKTKHKHIDNDGD